MNNTIIEIKNVTKQYRLGLIGGGTLTGDLQSWWARVRGKEDPNRKIGAKIYAKNEKFLALEGINLKINKGERVGIIGHNGAGKSTLLKLLSRVTAPTEGKIYLDGRISSMLEVGTGFHGDLTGRENIYLNGAILGMSREEVSSKIDKIIEFSECAKFIDTPVKRYSSGMYVKLAFAVAAHLDSEILIMDEVLAVGDMTFQQKCINKMSEVSKQDGRTILYVSHNMNTIRKLCDRCVVLDHGKVVFDGDVEEAISIYNKDTFNELTQVVYGKEDHGQYSTKDIEVVSAKFPGKQESYFELNEKQNIELTWKYNNDIDGLCLRVEILNYRDLPVATTMLENICNGKKGDVLTANIELELPGIVPGKYKTMYVFYTKNSISEKSIDLDYVKGLSFIINGKNDIVWEYANWGNVKLPKPGIKLH